MTLATTGTVLELTGITLRDFSSRALTFEMKPIDPGGLERDANGALHDLTLARFRKYEFTIQCQDTEAPVFDDVWKGKLVTVTILPKTGLSEETDQQSFDCMLVDWQSVVDEWGASTSWSMTLLEI